MRRAIFLQVIVMGLALAADTAPIVGKWYLLSSTDNEALATSHRMDLLFKTEAGQLKGAVLDRRDGREIPLATATFEGGTLRFQMVAPAGKNQKEMPTMVMTANGPKFEGAWTTPAGQKQGPTLKLVRAR